MKTVCPRCSRGVEIPDDMAGTQVDCPACKLAFWALSHYVPAPASTRRRYARQRRLKFLIMWAGIGLLPLWASSILYGTTGSSLALCLMCLSGLGFVCLAVFVCVVARKVFKDGITEMTSSLILIMVPVGFLAVATAFIMREARDYDNRFAALASEFREPYHRLVDEYKVAWSPIDTYLHGKKISWFACRTDGSLDPCEPPSGRSPGDVNPQLFAGSPEEVDFVVVEKELPDGCFLTVFHVPTKRVKASCFIGLSKVADTEIVIPRPGSGVVYVDKVIGPIGLRRVVKEVYPAQAIKEYIEDVCR